MCKLTSNDPSSVNLNGQCNVYALIYQIQVQAFQ